MQLAHDPRFLRRLVRHRNGQVGASAEGMRWLYGIIVFSLLVAALAWAVGGYHTGFHTLNALAPWAGEVFWQNLTHLGNGSVALALLLLFARNHPSAVWTGLIAAVFALLLSHGIKYGATTLRPPAVLDADAFHLIGRGWPTRSFPSGHTVTAFVFAAIFIAHMHSTLARALLLVAAILVGGSRVVVGVHWPIDVLAGAALGTAAAVIGISLGRRWRWGLQPVGHRICVLVLVVGTFGLFDEINGYPHAMLLSQTLAVLALAVASIDYLGPLLRAAAVRRLTSGSP